MQTNIFIVSFIKVFTEYLHWTGGPGGGGRVSLGELRTAGLR